MTDTNKKFSLRLSDYEGKDKEEFLEEVGSLVFKAALMRYLDKLNEDETRIFEAYMKVHAESETLFEDLAKTYPAFDVILGEEMKSLSDEITS